MNKKSNASSWTIIASFPPSSQTGAPWNTTILTASTIFTVANHMIEHVEISLTYTQSPKGNQMGGHLLYTVPDKNHTFDKPRNYQLRTPKGRTAKWRE